MAPVKIPNVLPDGARVPYCVRSAISKNALPKTLPRAIPANGRPGATGGWQCMGLGLIVSRVKGPHLILSGCAAAVC